MDALNVLSSRLREVEAREHHLTYAGNPDGLVTAVEGMRCWDTTNQRLYLNTSSGEGTSWCLIQCDPNGLGSTPEIVTIDSGDSPYTPAPTSRFYLLRCNCAGGAITVNLPTLADGANIFWHIKKIDSAANVVTVAANGAETIDGQASQTLNIQYEALLLLADPASEWNII